MHASGFQELLRRAQKGDAAAVEELLTSIRPYLSRVAQGFVDPSRASRSGSDLVQEAELRVWRSLGQFQGGATDEDSWAMFRTWLVQIVRRLMRDIQRDRTAQKRHPLGHRILPLPQGESANGTGAPAVAKRMDQPRPTESTASGKLAAKERAESVRRAMRELLPDTDRAIVESFFFEGATLRQISERLSLPYHKVKERYRESMKRLEHLLGEL